VIRIGNFVFALILTFNVGGGVLPLSLSPSWVDALLTDATPDLAAGETPSQADEETPPAVGEWQSPADGADKTVATPSDVLEEPAEASVPANADVSTDVDADVDDTIPADTDVDAPLDVDMPADTDESVSEGEWSADLSAPAHPSVPVPAPMPTSPEGDDARLSSIPLPAEGSLLPDGADSRAVTGEMGAAAADAVVDASGLSPYGDPSQLAVGAASATVDFSVLDAALADTSAIQQGSFTKASWDALQAAIANAQSIRLRADVTQAEVEAAVSALASAKVGLVTGGSSGFVGGLPQTGDTALPLMGAVAILTLLGTAALLTRRVRRAPERIGIRGQALRHAPEASTVPGVPDTTSAKKTVT
jgi:LPXTG-motif cell wall-anchored protein